MVKLFVIMAGLARGQTLVSMVKIGVKIGVIISAASVKKMFLHVEIYCTHGNKRCMSECTGQ